MIDKVKLNTRIQLDVSNFSSSFTYKQGTYLNKETGELIAYEYYFYQKDIVTVIYNVTTQTLKITGRLINLGFVKDKVNNFDDGLYQGRYTEVWDTEENELNDDEMCELAYYNADDELCFPDRTQYETFVVDEFVEDVDEILEHINALIYELTKTKVDVRNFNITYIEICFNIWLENDYVNEYIELFNLIFDSKVDKRYINFVRERNLKPYTSFYIKPKKEYEKQDKTNYTVNFYNKKNQLQYIKDKGKYKVTCGDIGLAYKVLRLEVQASYRYIKKIVDREGINKQFGDFLDIELCRDIILDKYKFFIDKHGNLDFYSYKLAKEKIQDTDNLTPKEKRALLSYIADVQRGYTKNYATHKKYRDKLAGLGIHHFFIPKQWNIDFLESPATLLKKKVEETQKQRKEYEDVVLNKEYTREDYDFGSCSFDDLPPDVKAEILGEQKKDEDMEKKIDKPFNNLPF